MIHGLDTGFLVAAEVKEHTDHVVARDTLSWLLAAGDLIAIAPQVLAEFIHKAPTPAVSASRSI
jgi:predicted nucleic acid-binding protein